MSNVELHISMDENYEPSARLRAAIEAVTEAYERSVPGAGDVEGYALQVGDKLLNPPSGKYGPRAPLSADGCWGYSYDHDSGDGVCVWFSGGDKSCVGFTW